MPKYGKYGYINKRGYVHDKINDQLNDRYTFKTMTYSVIVWFLPCFALNPYTQMESKNIQLF